MSELALPSEEFAGPPSDAAIVILAGGLGTRIKDFLGDLPKPMVSVAGRPFLEWVIRYFARQGIRRFVLSTGYRSEAVERHFSRQPVRDVEVVCVAETKPLGTAGGFLHAMAGSGFRSRSWLVANGDSLAFGGTGRQLSLAMTGASSATILGLRVPDTARYGALEVAADGTLLRFAEKRPGAGLINAGVYAFGQGLMDRFPVTRPLSFETQVFPALLGAGVRVAVETTEAAFLDIGTPASLMTADQFIRENRSFLLLD